jgi:hypothetical protein
MNSQCSYCHTEFKTEDDIKNAWQNSQSRQKVIMQEYHDNELIQCSDKGHGVTECFDMICPSCSDQAQM